MAYLTHLLTLMIAFGLAGLGLDLLMGHRGMLSFGQGSFFAIGAYTAGLLLSALRTDLVFVLILTCVISAALAAVLARRLVRIEDDSFAIATLALHMVVYHVIKNWTAVTGGAMGMPGIPRARFLGIGLSSSGHVLAFGLLMFLGVYALHWRLSGSMYGRSLRVIRDDIVWAQAAGRRPEQISTSVFVFAAVTAAIGGVVFAIHISFLDPTSFTLGESILIASLVIVGGPASAGAGGVFVGLALFILLPEGLRFLGLPSHLAAASRQIVFGFLLVVVMLVRPRGLLGKYDFQKSI